MTNNDMAVEPPEPAPRVADWYRMTVCGNCKAARLLQWQCEDGTIPSGIPDHAVELDPHLVVVHCDYFRRRIEQPGQLTHCQAQREITPGLNRWPKAVKGSP